MYFHQIISSHVLNTKLLLVYSKWNMLADASINYLITINYYWLFINNFFTVDRSYFNFLCKVRMNSTTKDKREEKKNKWKKNILALIRRDKNNIIIYDNFYESFVSMNWLLF